MVAYQVNELTSNEHFSVVIDYSTAENTPKNS